jgi:hypothetical protein
MNTKLVSRAIQVIIEYKQIYKSDQSKNEQISELSPYYIDRFNEAVKP